jgi:hypothetical protein
LVPGNAALALVVYQSIPVRMRVQSRCQKQTTLLSETLLARIETQTRHQQYFEMMALGSVRENTQRAQ